MSSIPFFECYREPLLPDSIRLLRLLPNEDKTAPIQCELFHYPLQESGGRTHPYEALSYVWGGSNKPQSISIREHNSKSGHSATRRHDLPVTENLHAALTHLRYPFYERIIWIDAVCINQNDEREKEQQIQFMAKIYALANCVVVWLGEAAENSDKALHWIRDSGGKNSKISASDETIQQAVIALLQRPWFRRIWVLQEVAAARRISIVCGATEIDGYAFCLVVDSLEGFNKTCIDLQSLARSVTYLIRGAIFRPDFSMSGSGRPSLDICPLSELMDMYHTHEATKRHDKVFALLGMSSDDLSKSKLLPDYRVLWEELLQRLIKYLLYEEISVKAWGGDREVAVIESKGRVLGKLLLVQSDPFRDAREGVNVIFNNREGSTRWTLQASAKPVRDGDLVCLLQGVSKPTIIRQRQDYFDIVMIAARPPEKIPVGNGYVKWPRFLQLGLSFTRDFALIWDWEVSLEKFQPLRDDRLLEYSMELTSNLDKATRIWNIALVLEDLEDYEEAEKKTREAIKGYHVALELPHPYALKSEQGLTPLLWAAENGHDSVVSLLLTKYNVDPDGKDNQVGRTPLSWAAEGGHEGVAKLLLGTRKVEVDPKDNSNRTPLSWAAEGGHEAVVKLLIGTGKAEVDSRDSSGRTPLWWAAKGGHEIVVKQLLETDKVEEVDLKDNSGRTPLLWAAKGGHEAIVKILLKTGKVDVDSRDNFGRTPLSCAAEEGHETVVKLLLETGKVEVNSKDRWYFRTPLSWAAEGGYETVVDLLLKTSKVEVHSKDDSRRTPLLWAAKGGHVAIVKLLLETDKVKVNSKDDIGRTPFFWAAKEGHEAIVKLLLETGKVDVDLRDWLGGTPLSWAAERGHEAVIKLLQSSTK